MMKKRILTIVAALMMAITPAMAQIFIVEDEWNDDRVERDPVELGVMVPEQDVPYDQYTPIGEGFALLTGMGLVYLLGRRKKDKE